MSYTHILIQINALSYDATMLTVELNGGLGIVGYKSEALWCYMCDRRTCEHVNAVQSKKNSDLPAIEEFELLSSIPQKQYLRKCFSTQKIPFYPIDEDCSKIQSPPWAYLNLTSAYVVGSQQSIADLGKNWHCTCGADEHVLLHLDANVPLLSTDCLIYVDGKTQFM